MHYVWLEFSALLGSMASLYREEAFVDTTIVADNKIFKAHKLLLSASSSYLRSILEVSTTSSSYHNNNNNIGKKCIENGHDRIKGKVWCEDLLQILILLARRITCDDNDDAEKINIIFMNMILTEMASECNLSKAIPSLILSSCYITMFGGYLTARAHNFLVHYPKKL